MSECFKYAVQIQILYCLTISRMLSNILCHIRSIYLNVFWQSLCNRSLRVTDSKAIVDGNLKLILGLIWTLILHYSISMPMWDEEEETEESKQKTPKQRLLGWIQNKLPELPITNFSRDWQSGKALGALVDSCAPGKRGFWEL